MNFFRKKYMVPLVSLVLLGCGGGEDVAVESEAIVLNAGALSEYHAKKLSSINSVELMTAAQFSVGANIAAPIGVYQKPLYRFYNGSVGGHFYTTNDYEKDYVSSNYANYSYEGVSFSVYTDNISGLSPVYRFYNSGNGTHFYTISENEKLFIINNYKIYSYEGISFYASQVFLSQGFPVYRFFNSAKGTHFYTASISERDAIIGSMPAYIYEGVAYYNPTSNTDSGGGDVDIEPPFPVAVNQVSSGRVMNVGEIEVTGSTIVGGSIIIRATGSNFSQSALLGIWTTDAAQDQTVASCDLDGLTRGADNGLDFVEQRCTLKRAGSFNIFVKSASGGSTLKTKTIDVLDSNSALSSPNLYGVYYGCHQVNQMAGVEIYFQDVPVQGAYYEVYMQTPLQGSWVTCSNGSWGERHSRCVLGEMPNNLMGKKIQLNVRARSSSGISAVNGDVSLHLPSVCSSGSLWGAGKPAEWN